MTILKMTRKQFNGCLNRLCSAYPFQPITLGDDTREIWYEAISSTDPRDMVMLCNWWIGHKPEFPKSIVELVDGMLQSIESYRSLNLTLDDVFKDWKNGDTGGAGQESGATGETVSGI